MLGVRLMEHLETARKDDRPKFIESLIEDIIDNEVIVFPKVGHLGDGIGHPPTNGLDIVLAAPAEP